MLGRSASVPRLATAPIMAGASRVLGLMAITGYGLTTLTKCKLYHKTQNLSIAKIKKC
ncbi:protein of unknown function [Limnospira indica PCC 8005]|uniref:Uncharacterized protein n=1 Tax=Limnospira indica PCC 8005 TaxID=376219 RepID=A0A9P1NY42_9CYAN|nr:protein of unknown function [Limnospira indica PCC 8005]